MPWFYFHLRTPAGLEPDDMGLEFGGIEAAYLEACHSVPEMSAELARKKADPLRYAFEITDVAGTLVMDVPFSEVLDRRCRPVPPLTATRARKAAAEMERTASLIASINEERAALQVTLAETRRLLVLSRNARSARP